MEVGPSGVITVAGVQVGDDGRLDQGAGSAGGSKWTDSKYILEVESPRLHGF